MIETSLFVGLCETRRSAADHIILLNKKSPHTYLDHLQAEYGELEGITRSHLHIPPEGIKLYQENTKKYGEGNINLFVAYALMSDELRQLHDLTRQKSYSGNYPGAAAFFDASLGLLWVLRDIRNANLYHQTSQLDPLTTQTRAQDELIAYIAEPFNQIDSQETADSVEQWLKTQTPKRERRSNQVEFEALVRQNVAQDQTILGKVMTPNDRLMDTQMIEERIRRHAKLLGQDPTGLTMLEQTVVEHICPANQFYWRILEFPYVIDEFAELGIRFTAEYCRRVITTMQRMERESKEIPRWPAVALLGRLRLHKSNT